MSGSLLSRVSGALLAAGLTTPVLLGSGASAADEPVTVEPYAESCGVQLSTTLPGPHVVRLVLSALDPLQPLALMDPEAVAVLADRPTVVAAIPLGGADRAKRYRVSLEVDGEQRPVVELTLPACATVTSSTSPAATPDATPGATATPSGTPAGTPTATPSAPAEATASPAATASPGATGSPGSTASPGVIPSPGPTASPGGTASTGVSASASPAPAEPAVTIPPTPGTDPAPTSESPAAGGGGISGVVTLPGNGVATAVAPTGTAAASGLAAPPVVAPPVVAPPVVAPPAGASLAGLVTAAATAPLAAALPSLSLTPPVAAPELAPRAAPVAVPEPGLAPPADAFEGSLPGLLLVASSAAGLLGLRLRGRL